MRRSRARVVHRRNSRGKTAVLRPVRSGLSADQRAARLPAALSHALDHGCADLGLELSTGEIVEEKQRFCALYDQVAAPINAQPACRQPSATPLITDAPISGSSCPQAK